MNRRQLVERAAIIILLLLVAASILLAALPTEPASALIAKSDWSIDGQAFQNASPQPLEVRNSIRDSTETVYWRTWSPETQATKAHITTKAFAASPYMAIPYGGFAGSPGIRLSLVCQETGKSLSVATARTNTQMTEALLHDPSGWCHSAVVLDAKSESTSKYLVVGTPFKISWSDYYKSSFVGLIGIFVVVFAFTWGLLVLPDMVATLYGYKLDSIVAGMAFLGVIGYVMFFAFFESFTLGKILASCLFVIECIAMYRLYSSKRPSLASMWQRWKLPTALWAFVALSAFCLAMATNNGAGPWTVNNLFNPVRWSSDNQLPMQISEYLFHGLDPRTLNLGPWKISDRPPLAYGLMATLRLLSWTVASHGDGSPLYFQYQLISGIVINGLWVVALYYLLSALKLKKIDVYWIALIVGVTPFAIFNSVYIWPKMLGAAFGLVAFVLLFEPAEYQNGRGYRKMGTSFLWAALLSGLALMCHGGTAFGIIAAIIVALLFRGLPSPGKALGAALIGASVLAPWALWQHFEQPPGNALIKYAFSGNFGFGEESKGVLSTIQDAYSKLTLSSWSTMKLDALRIITTGEGSTCGIQEAAPAQSFYGLLRVQDFFYFGPSLRFLTIGLIPLIFTFKSSNKSKISANQLHFARIMASTGLLSIGLYTLVGFDCYINHMQSYQSVLEILTGLALVLYFSENWFYKLMVYLSIAYSLAVWIIDPVTLSIDPSVTPLLVLGVIALIVYRRLSADPVGSENLGNGPDH